MYEEEVLGGNVDHQRQRVEELRVLRLHISIRVAVPKVSQSA